MLNLVFYRVNEMQFIFDERVKPNTAFKINPKIECKLAKNANGLTVDMILKINEDISSPVPFNLKVRLTGGFSGDVSGNEKDLMNEAFSILFPYMRAVVSTLTVNCNVPAYVLPAISRESLEKSENPAENPAQVN